MISDLHVIELKKQMKDFVLEANFTVKAGERMILMGKSGSGKTTLLRILSGLEPLNQGRILFGNQEITSFSPQKREVGFVFQDQVLFSSLNVLENVTFGLRMRGVPTDERRAIGEEWLSRMDLQSKLNGSVDELSGGEKQRVAFARAMVWKPRALLLDEPFSALDPETKKKLRMELIELHRLWPVPLVLVSHDEGDLQLLATSKMSVQWNEKTNKRVVLPFFL